MRELNDNNTDTAGAPENFVHPAELAALIDDSASVLPGILLGTGAFTVLAWFTGTVAWLNTIAVVVAIVLGLRGLWHVVFLVRAALRFRDELALAVEQAEEAAALARFLRDSNSDFGEGW
ncbi:hypothetical protein AB0M80_05655 [Amycolatopsis sp. NPDC051045]|uniref:hypothetical protein n=1 Tax=Amycolatopsis sp. NPDC051045 TaxID=3156922 RepID=UPI003438FB4B